MPFKGSYQAKSELSGANWLGFQQVALTDVVDKSDDYDNLDMFIEFHFKNESSQYPYRYGLLGTWDKDTDGKISGESSLLKRVLYLISAIGWDGGVNTEGEWVDKDDKPLVDEDNEPVNIADFLNTNFTAANYGASNFETPYYIFVYRRYSEKDSRAFQTVCPKIVPNDSKNRKDLESYIKYMKANKFIVEHEEKKQVQNGEITASSPATVGGSQTTF